MDSLNLDFLEAIGVLESLESLPSRTSRKDRLALLQKNQSNAILKEIFILTYDWRLQFQGVKIFANDFASFENSLLPVGTSWPSFQKLTAELVAGKLAGFKARRSALSLLSKSAPLESKWYARILQRDLQIGLNQKLLSQIWPDLGVEFKLAHISSGENVSPEFPLLAEPEPIGIPVALVIHNNRCHAFTVANHRYYPTLEQAFGSQLLRLCSDGVFHGFLYSKDLELMNCLLNSKFKSLDKFLFKELYYSLKFRMIDFTSQKIFSSQCGFTDQTSFIQRRAKLEYYYKKIKANNSRTSISVEPLQTLFNSGELESFTIGKSLLLHSQNQSYRATHSSSFLSSKASK